MNFDKSPSSPVKPSKLLKKQLSVILWIPSDKGGAEIQKELTLCSSLIDYKCHCSLQVSQLVGTGFEGTRNFTLHSLSLAQVNLSAESPAS